MILELVDVIPLPPNLRIMKVTCILFYIKIHRKGG